MFIQIIFHKDNISAVTTLYCQQIQQWASFPQLCKIEWLTIVFY